MSDDALDPEDGLVADDDAALEALLAVGASGPEPEDERGRRDAERHRALLAMYLDEIRNTPLLTPEEEQELARRVQAGDAEAERRLVEANLRLVIHLARRYMNRGLPLLDLIEEGNLGLLHAVRKFQPGRGTRFSTYGAWWIRHAIVRALANQARLVRLPVHVELSLSQYVKVRQALTQKLGRTPTIEELAAHLGRPVAEVEDLETLRQQQPVSLDAPSAAGGKATLQDSLRDPEAGPDPILSRLLRERTDLTGVLQDLTDNERTVITQRFGLGGDEPRTLEAIGQRLGVSRERVRQIEAQALRRLRALMAARGVEPSDLL